jgi:site-specific DNA-methyltransferase (adenine-specific)
VTTCNTTGGATIMGSFPYPRNGIVKIDYEFILIFKKHGKAPSVSKTIKEKSKLSKEEWNQYFYGHWNFSGAKQDAHLAPFPEELPKRLIKMFSFVGDTVLDPFLGSGTTSLAALNLSRNSIGYEINRGYQDKIKQRLQKNVSVFEKETKIEVVEQHLEKVGFTEEIQSLPYNFEDPVIFERKVDPKLLKFGSRIDGNETSKDRYYTVKKVISPSELVLETGARIRLIGIKENGKKSKLAIGFLEDLTKGQKVFLMFDQVKKDKNSNLLCYLYLRNKTFINAHLIKRHLVDVDTTYSYKHKSKFLGYTRSRQNATDKMDLRKMQG